MFVPLIRDFFASARLAGPATTETHGEERSLAAVSDSEPTVVADLQMQLCSEHARLAASQWTFLFVERYGCVRVVAPWSAKHGG